MTQPSGIEPDSRVGDSSRANADDRDAIIVRLLDELASDARTGKAPDFTALARRYPDLADEVRMLWATAMVAEDFASFSDALDSVDRLQSAEAKPPGKAPSFESRQRVGDYEILDEIGRGGMGVVFRARQISLDRIVALKMILRGELASAADLTRFRGEAESAAQLHHPHVTAVYEIGDHEGQPYFSMQLVEGTTLARRIADGPLPAREAAQLLLPVCRAIAEAHRNGLLHRDLKPSNILIDRTGHPFVSDFGLAKRVTADKSDGDEQTRSLLTHSGAIIGTPGYMAPEQAAGNRGEVGRATDVYGLGALLYATLTGRAPFQSGIMHLTKPTGVVGETGSGLAGSTFRQVVEVVVRNRVGPAPERLGHACVTLIAVDRRLLSRAWASGVKAVSAVHRDINLTDTHYPMPSPGIAKSHADDVRVVMRMHRLALDRA